MTYFVLGIEPFKYAEIHGQHESKKIAISQAEKLEQKKSPLCCQNYTVMTCTEIKKQKLILYSNSCVITA